MIYSVRYDKRIFFFYLDFSVYDHSRSAKDSPRNNLRTSSKLTRECKIRLFLFYLSNVLLFCLGKSLLEEQEWYEKDLSDFDDPQISDEEQEGTNLRS